MALVLLSATGCEREVVIGIFDDLIVTPVDAGRDAGGPSGDGGVADAGFDAGADDGGADAGFDAGADGGVADAGVDAGTDGGVDAGFDAGPADLVVTVPGLQVFEIDAGALSLTINISNDGGQAAGSAAFSLGLPAGVTPSSPPAACAVDAGQLRCALGTLAGKSAVTVPVDVSFTVSPRWFVLPVQATTSSVEASTANNRGLVPISLTPAGTVAAPIVSDRTLTITFCAGTNISTFAQCVPGSTLTEVLTFFADGGLVDDIGFPGVWGQATHKRNLAFRFDDGTTLGASYSGGSVSAQCFEGPYDNYMGIANSGAWRGCLNP